MRLANKILIILAVLLITVPAWSTPYYVNDDATDCINGDTDYSPPTDSCGSGSYTIYTTIGNAEDVARAGDIVWIRAGTYVENVVNGYNGTSGNLITFAAYESESVIIRPSSNGVTVWNAANYVRLIGLIIDGQGTYNYNRGIDLSGTTGVELWNNTIRYADDATTRDGLYASNSNHASKTLIIGNTVKTIAGYAARIAGSNLLITANEYDDSMDFQIIHGGDYTIVRNNFFHNPNDQWSPGAHIDGLQLWCSSGTDPTTFLTFEANFIVHDQQTDYHYSNMSANAGCNAAGVTEILHRFNLGHDVGAVYTNGSNIDVGIFIQNSFVNSSTGNQYALAMNNGTNGRLFNNIYDNLLNHNSPMKMYSGTRSATPGEDFYSDYNLAFDEDCSGPCTRWTSPISSEANTVFDDNPDFNGKGTDDFTIQAGSPAVNTAGPPTLANGSGSSSTALIVDDASYFRGDNTNIDQYGGNLVVGDLIKIGSGSPVRISSISGNNITLEAARTWSNNDPVYYAESTGAIDDIGAFPYRAGGFTYSATYVLAASTVTVTPSDADLVRMVVVFEDTLPVGADSTSPFTVSSVGSGTLDVRVYPRYASKTLYVTASESGGGGDVTPPETSGHSPNKGASGIAIGEDIIWHVTDSGDGVDGTMVEAIIEGVLYCCADGSCENKTLSRSGTSADYTITHSHNDYDNEQVINVTLGAKDLASPPNQMTPDVYSFTTVAAVGPGSVTLTGGSKSMDVTGGGQTMSW